MPRAPFMSHPHWACGLGRWQVAAGVPAIRGGREGGLQHPLQERPQQEKELISSSPMGTFKGIRLQSPLSRP